MLSGGAIAVTAPLAWRLGDGLPIGREGVATVANFNLWSLSWTASRIPHGLAGWWDAPIFWPARGTYANSELQPLTGLVFWLLRGLVSDAAAYGLILILAVMLNGWSTYRLARRLGCATGSATAAGVLVEMLPFAMTQLGVLQLLMLWPILVAVERFLAWVAEPKTGTAVGLGLALAASYLTCGYHAALFVVVAVPAALTLVRRPLRFDRVRVGQMMIAASIVVTLCLPFAIGQQSRLDGITWTRETIVSGSATWASLAPGGSNWVGWPLAVLGGLGALVGRRRPEVRFLVVMVVLAELFALGLRLSVFGWRPYELLVEHISAFGRLRSPFRATALAQLALAALSAVALTQLSRRRRRLSGAVACGAVIAAAIVGPVGSGPISALPALDTPWIEWLDGHPGGAVAALPMAAGRGVEDFEPTSRSMLQGLEHGHPLVNGYSGFFPTGQREQREVLNRFPDEESIAELRRVGARYVVADAAWWTSDRDEDARRFGLTVVLAGPAGVLLQLDS